MEISIILSCSSTLWPRSDFQVPPASLGGRGAVQACHWSFAPACPLWSSSLSCGADVFAADGVFLGAAIGHRPVKSVATWEGGDDIFFGYEAISRRKLAAEGPANDVWRC